MLSVTPRDQVAADNLRVERAIDLIEVFGAIKRNANGSYSVLSQWTANKSYTVKCGTCTCPDFVFRGNKCKHIIAVEQFARKAALAQASPIRAF